jgi:hypothetical protein
MAKRKFFIRKTQSDLVQEQTRLLLETMALTQNKQPASQIQIQYGEQPAATSGFVRPIYEEEFDFEIEESAPYIQQITSTSTGMGSAKLPTVDTNKVIFDGEGVEKLKKARGNKENEA